MNKLTAHIRILDDYTPYGTNLRLHHLQIVRYRHEFSRPSIGLYGQRRTNQLAGPHAYHFSARTHVWSHNSSLVMPKLKPGTERLVIYINFPADSTVPPLSASVLPHSLCEIVVILPVCPYRGPLRITCRVFASFFLLTLVRFGPKIHVTFVGFENALMNTCHHTPLPSVRDPTAAAATLEEFIEDIWSPRFEEDELPRFSFMALDVWSAVERTTEEAKLEATERLPDVPGLHWF